jgi:hypothetical protein
MIQHPGEPALEEYAMDAAVPICPATSSRCCSATSKGRLRNHRSILNSLSVGPTHCALHELVGQSLIDGRRLRAFAGSTHLRTPAFLNWTLHQLTGPTRMASRNDMGHGPRAT